VHATPAFEAVMDLGKEDQDDGDDRESGEVVDDDDVDKENKDKEVEENEPSEPEAKKRKERIVKLEEGRRKIKLKNHTTTEIDEEKGEVKMEVEQQGRCWLRILFVILPELSEIKQVCDQLHVKFLG